MSAYRTLSDTQLTDLLKTDDHAAFSEIYRRHWKKLAQGAFKATGSRENSMDICQSIFTWLWENRETVNISVNIKVYLQTAVRYKIANLIRQGKVREILFEDLEVVDMRAYEENELEIKELKSFITQLIDGLPARCREVFLLSRDEQLSHKEIADKLGLSEKTVDEQIHRALKKLKIPLNRLASVFLMF